MWMAPFTPLPKGKLALALLTTASTSVCLTMLLTMTSFLLAHPCQREMYIRRAFGEF